MKVLKITRKDFSSGLRPIFPLLEGFLQDIVAAVYLQVRDTVGAEIHRQLSTDIKDQFEKIFSERLEQVIEQKFEQKQLPPVEKGRPE
jgi:hypothetical protein